MPLPLTVSCFNKIQIGFTFLVLAHLGSPRRKAIKRVCVCHSWACPDVPVVSIFNFTHSWACPDVPVVSSFNLIHWGAAAIRPLATSATATCFVAMAGIRTGLRWRLTTSGVKRTSSLRCIQTARGHSSTSPSKLRSLTGNLVFCVLSCTHTHREKKNYSPQSK